MPPADESSRLRVDNHEAAVTDLDASRAVGTDAGMRSISTR